jgi:ribonuclease HII
LEGRCYSEGCHAVAGVDEVGRGAWAGPVSVGIAVMTRGGSRRLPAGLRDSKQLSLAAREALFEPLTRVLADWAVGHASNEECDALGMTGAQALAARRALGRLTVAPDVLLLDGSYDFLGQAGAPSDLPPVRTVVKGDASVTAIAAASVLAKVTRDRLMAAEAEHYPWYGFESNRGYPSPVHKMALAAWGCTPTHRRSWSFVDGLYYRPAGRHGSALAFDRRLLRETEHALGEDVAHDLVGASGDADAGNAEHEARPRIGSPFA